MSLNITSPVTGSAQTGFTSPTYTVATDSAPDTNGKQVYVSALGGTQTGVNVHSISSPFTCLLVRPKAFKMLKSVVAGTPLTSVPRNIWRVMTRKGVTPALSQSPVVCSINTELNIPAGADAYDKANIQAAIALHIGVLTQLSASLGDSVSNGSF